MSNEARKKIENTAPETPEKIFRLLDRVRKGGPVNIRDDQYDYLTIMDAARSYGRRIGLIDSGRFSLLQMESIAKAGIAIYSSDEARADIEEIGLIRKACAKGGSFLAFFLNAGLRDEDRQGKIPFPVLKELAESGVYMHVSNRQEKHDGSRLAELSRSCRRGGSWLVYYHHGPLESFLADLAASGAWIHLSDQSLAKDEDFLFFRELAGRGKRLVLFVEKILPASFLRDMYRAGVFLFFKTPPIDPGSPHEILEKKAGRKKLKVKAYYTSYAFLP